jgi:hypothetical protein
MTRHLTAEPSPRRTRPLGRALMLLAIALAVSPDVVRADAATDEAPASTHERHRSERQRRREEAAAKKAASDTTPAAEATPAPEAVPAQSSASQPIAPSMQVQPTLHPDGMSVASPASPATPPVPAGPAGKLEVKETTFDAGTVERGVKLSHAFELKNVGEHDLTVDAKPG